MPSTVFQLGIVVSGFGPDRNRCKRIPRVWNTRLVAAQIMRLVEFKMEMCVPCNIFRLLLRGAKIIALQRTQCMISSSSPFVRAEFKLGQSAKLGRRRLQTSYLPSRVPQQTKTKIREELSKALPTKDWAEEEECYVDVRGG